MALKSVERRVDELELNKQDTLVSGVTIKTINGNSVLGSGNLVISTASTITVGTTAVTSGTDGRVFFQSGGVVQQDSSLFWDNTNKRLGVGTNSPTDSIEIFGYSKNIRINGAVSDRSVILGSTSNGTGDFYLFNGNNTNSVYITGNGTSFFNGGNVSIGTTANAARLDVRAQGALSTDIVQRWRNSANTADIGSIRGNGIWCVGLLASAPTGVEGAIYYDSTTKKHYGFDGTTWNALY